MTTTYSCVGPKSVFFLLQDHLAHVIVNPGKEGRRMKETMKHKSFTEAFPCLDILSCNLIQRICQS